MKLNGKELNNVDHFKYLGSVINTDDTIDIDVDIRVHAYTTGSSPQAQRESIII